MKIVRDNHALDLQVGIGASRPHSQSIGMKPRVMLIDTSNQRAATTIAGLESDEWDLEVCDDIDEALQTLDQQFQYYERELDCVVFSWARKERAPLERLLSQLGSADFHDLKVVVLEVGHQPEARAWAASRAHSAILPHSDLLGLVSQVRQYVNPQPLAHNASISGEAMPNAEVSILIVDDSPSIRHGLSALLSKQGYQVDAAASISQARERVNRRNYDIAVIDYYLGEDTGDMLCRELTGLPLERRPACAILTGTYSDMIIQRALRAGAIECMFKNESHDLLLARIEAISLSVRQNKRLRAILEAMPHGVLCVNPRGQVVYANRQLRRLAERRADDFLDLSLHELFDPLPESLSIMLREQGGDVHYAEQARLLPPRGGDPLTVSLSATALRQGQQGEGYVISVIPHTEAMAQNLKASSPVAASQEAAQQNLSWQQFVSLGELMLQQIGAHVCQFALIALYPHCAIRNRPQAQPVPLKAMAHLREPLKQFLNNFAPPDRIMALEDGSYCLLIAYTDEEKLQSQAARLVRHLPDIGLRWRFLEIATHTAILPLQVQDLQNAERLMVRVQHALQQAADRGPQRLYYSHRATREEQFA